MLNEFFHNSDKLLYFSAIFRTFYEFFKLLRIFKNLFYHIPTIFKNIFCVSRVDHQKLDKKTTKIHKKFQKLI